MNHIAALCELSSSASGSFAGLSPTMAGVDLFPNCDKVHPCFAFALPFCHFLADVVVHWYHKPPPGSAAPLFSADHQVHQAYQPPPPASLPIRPPFASSCYRGGGGWEPVVLVHGSCDEVSKPMTMQIIPLQCEGKRLRASRAVCGLAMLAALCQPGAVSFATALY